MLYNMHKFLQYTVEMSLINKFDLSPTLDVLLKSLANNFSYLAWECVVEFHVGSRGGVSKVVHKRSLQGKTCAVQQDS